MAIAVIATIPIAAGSSGASDETTSPETTESTVPTTGSLEETADTLEPTTGTYTEGEVRLTFTVPEGWEHLSAAVIPTDSDPIFGTMFMPVATSSPIPANRWRLTHHPVPPSMTSSPHSPACPPSTPPRQPTSPSTDSTASRSSSPSPTTPTTNANSEGSPCFSTQRMLGWVPATGPQGPHAHYRLWILDIDGTRYVIGGNTFPDTSQQDRDDLDTILNSIQIDDLVETEQSGDDDPVEPSAASVTSA